MAVYGEELARIIGGVDGRLAPVDWTIRRGEAWAIVGPTGSGKSTLAEVLAGRRRLTSDEARVPEGVGIVAFREESRAFSYSKHYHQQRFNFIEPDDDLTLEQFLRSGGPVDEPLLDELTQRFGIAELRPRSFIKMSNGQTRRSRIVKALLRRPSLLVLDEPFVGLDSAGRAEVDATLRRLHAEGLTLVVIVPAGRVPVWIRNVLEMSSGFHGGSANLSPPAPLSEAERGETVVEMHEVNVSYGGVAILRDVNWTVRQGERWAILGANGSGKTTLLSLIVGDNPQAYGNDVSLFGRRRGTGESIWDVKRRIGFVSPELHLYFTSPLTADRAAATGYFDVLFARPTTLEQNARVAALFDHFGVADLRPRRFASLSTGQQRIVLLIRALVKDAELLVLDEPFQTLDEVTAGKVREWIDALPPERTVLFVTHDEAELPRSVAWRLRVDGGRIESYQPD